MNVKSPNNIRKWQVDFYSAFKGLRNEFDKKKRYYHARVANGMQKIKLSLLVRQKR
jgi:hypothetical protein